MDELFTGFLLIILYFLACASSALVLRWCCPVPEEVFRKLLHFILLGSLLVWLTVFETWWISAASALLFALLVFPILSLAERIPGYSALLTERKGGEIKMSLLLVFGMYAAITTLCWGLLGDKLLALASLYAWGIGDAAAALVGKRFGKHPIYWKWIGGRKSFEGSLAMLVLSFLSVLTILLLRGSMSNTACALAAALTAFVSAAVELYTPGGLDTVTCPLAAAAVLLPTVYLLGGGL